MVNMGANGQTSLPYGGDIDKLATLATPFYGWDADAFRNFAGNWRGAPALQRDEMTLGGHFLWTLHSRSTLYSRHLAVGTTLEEPTPPAIDGAKDPFVALTSAGGATLASESRFITGYTHIPLLFSGIPGIANVTKPSSSWHQGYALVPQYLLDEDRTGRLFNDMGFTQSPVMLVTTNQWGIAVSNNVAVDGRPWFGPGASSLNHNSGSDCVCYSAPDVISGNRTFTIQPFGLPDSTNYGVIRFSTAMLPGRLSLLGVLQPSTTLTPDGLSLSMLSAWNLLAAYESGAISANSSVDGSGLTLQWKQWLGLNPTNADSCVRIDATSAAIVQVNSNLAFGSRFDTAPGISYQPQARDTLSSAWQDVGGPIMGSGTSVQFTDTQPVAASRHYRLRVYRP